MNNYQQMLEGDEATLQTIRDEQQEKRRVESVSGQPSGREAMQEDQSAGVTAAGGLGAAGGELDIEEELLGEIERASDDQADEEDEEDEIPRLTPMKRAR